MIDFLFTPILKWAFDHFEADGIEYKNIFSNTSKCGTLTDSICYLLIHILILFRYRGGHWTIVAV